MSYIAIPVPNTDGICYRVVTLLPVGVDNVRMTPGPDVYKPFDNHGALAAQGEMKIEDAQVVAIDAPQAPWIEPDARSGAGAAHLYTAVNAARYVNYLNGGSVTPVFPNSDDEDDANSRVYRIEEGLHVKQKKLEDEKKSK